LPGHFGAGGISDDLAAFVLEDHRQPVAPILERSGVQAGPVGYLADDF